MVYYIDVGSIRFGMHDSTGLLCEFVRDAPDVEMVWSPPSADSARSGDLVAATRELFFEAASVYFVVLALGFEDLGYTLRAFAKLIDDSDVGVVVISDWDADSFLERVPGGDRLAAEDARNKGRLAWFSAGQVLANFTFSDLISQD